MHTLETKITESIYGFFKKYYSKVMYFVAAMENYMLKSQLKRILTISNQTRIFQTLLQL